MKISASKLMSDTILKEEKKNEKRLKGLYAIDILVRLYSTVSDAEPGAKHIRKFLQDAINDGFDTLLLIEEGKV